MIGEFSEESRKALNLAKKEMMEMHHPFIGSEHLLLGILSLKNNLTNILRKYNLTYYSFKKELINVVGKSSGKSNFYLYTPLLKKILERVSVDSKDTNEEVTVTNLFLSILTEGEGVAYRIIISLGIDIDKLYKELINTNTRISKRLLIDEIGIDLNKEALNNKLDPVIGRKKEVNNLIEILARRNKNNPILVGDAGVGKTAIVEELARLIVNKNVPDYLLDKRIISVDISSLIAGTKYRGDFEEKLKRIINELVNNQDIIVFFDEIHTLVGAGKAEGAVDASNILKPYLARGNIKVIGATTLTEYKSSIEKDKALERRFQKIIVKEPNSKSLKEILTKLKPLYEEYHKVKISNKTIDELINLSRKYIYNRYEPDRSIDILDEVCSKVHLRRNKEEKRILEINNELNNLNKEKDKSLKKNNYELACLIKDKELELLKEKEELNSILLNKNKKVVTVSDIKEVISYKTGIPIDNKIDYKRIKDILKKDIVGQDNVVNELISITKKINMNIKDNNKSYSLLFSGSTGVGKTFLAKRYGSLISRNILKIDMNEFISKESINKLIGSPAGYVGYEDNNNLLEKIKNNPFSVLILDEIEKADTSIINFFLNILDEGYCYDNKGDIIRFDNVLIIMTTNALINKKNVGFNNKSMITNNLPKEFLNRIDEVLEFNSLSEKDIDIIIKNEIERFNKKNNMDIILSDEEINNIKESSNYEIFGARKVYRLVKKELNNKYLLRI